MPKHDVAVKLANALGISDDEEKYLEFLSAAEDLKGFRLVKVEDEEEKKEQESGTHTYTPVRSAKRIPDSIFDTTGDQIEEIKHLIDSVSLTTEEKEVVASHLDTLERFLKFIAAQRKIQKKG